MPATPRQRSQDSNQDTNLSQPGVKGVTGERNPLLIVGASVRAAAQSAIRAGLHPVCADLYADEDLRAIAKVLPLRDYPRGLPAAVRLAPAAPWIYTGALENHPGVIEAVCRERPLWGNSGNSLARIRDPAELQRALVAADLAVAQVRASSDPPALDGTWMLKPIRSAGGRGIRIWDASAPSPNACHQEHYFQQRLHGEPMSALFVTTSTATHFVGASRQFVGLDWLNAGRFAYCGSLGPLELSEELDRTLPRIGSVLAREFGLRGLFGCDFVSDGRSVWLTEVNPRYTASVEIFEHALGISVLAHHCQACLSFAHDADFHPAPAGLCEDTTVPRHRFVAKAILFSHTDFEVPDALVVESDSQHGGIPLIADVPRVGTKILRGHPVCTILSGGDDQYCCLSELRHRVETVHSRLFGARTEAAPDFGRVDFS